MSAWGIPLDEEIGIEEIASISPRWKRLSSSCFCGWFKNKFHFWIPKKNFGLGRASLDVVEEASNPFPIPLGLVSSSYCGLLAWR